MKLIDNWKAVLKTSYTSWAAALAFLLANIEIWHADLVAALPIFTALMPDGVAGKLSAAVVAAIPLLRLIKQLKLAASKAPQ